MATGTGAASDGFLPEQLRSTMSSLPLFAMNNEGHVYPRSRMVSDDAACTVTQARVSCARHSALLLAVVPYESAVTSLAFGLPEAWWT